MHIDGSHTGKIVYNDLTIANKLLSDDGILIIDDFTFASYHDILKSFYKYNYENDNIFKLLLLSTQKAYMCKKAAYEKYIKILDNSLIDYLKNVMTEEYLTLRLFKPIMPIDEEYYVIIFDKSLDLNSDLGADVKIVYKRN